MKEKVDIIFSVLHGSFGEDGKIQKILEKYNIKFVGSSSNSSYNSFSKIISKQVFEENNIKTPAFSYLNKNDVIDFAEEAEKIFAKFNPKVVIKTSESGSSFGVYICGSVNEITRALEGAFEIGDDVLVEEYMAGKEYTCGVIEEKNGEIRALPIVEIIPRKEFFDFEAKYEGAVDEICPAEIENEDLKKQIHETAVKVHKVLKLSDYSRTDFIFDDKRGLYVLEVNTLPGMTEISLYPQELKADGIGLSGFLDILLINRLKRL